jgi:hypothetical protein
MSPRPYDTSAGGNLVADSVYLQCSPQIVALQTERREVLLARLQALDERDAGRRLAQEQDAKAVALRCLSAHDRLLEVDQALARLDRELAEVAR